MSLIKNIAGETAIYGLSSIIGRAVNFLLVPLYTAVLTETGDYGIVGELYAYVAFMMVLMVYRFETAFFRFGTEEGQRENAYSTAMSSLVVSSAIFALVLSYAAPALADVLRYGEGESIFITMLVWVLFFDVLAEIPFARLRLENKAVRFAGIRLTNIIINIGLNLFFLLACPWILEQASWEWMHSFINSIYQPGFEVGYIFLSNLIASLVTLLLLMPEINKSRWTFDSILWKKMLSYSLPLVIVGLAGVANEMLDRVLLKWMLPYDFETNEARLGIYNACYKLAMLMALFTQAYRYAAEPFFFRHSKREEAPGLYAIIARYFAVAGVLGFLVITLFMEYVQLVLVTPAYREGLAVVPILLMANLFLGLYYNLSVWYKLTDRTKMAAWISVGGAVITILLNIYWIPRIGFMGSAWATLVTYSAMTAASYFIGRKYYPLPIHWGRILLYIGLGLAIYFTHFYLDMADFSAWTRNGLRVFMIGLYLLIVFLMERKMLAHWLKVS